jgi:hypothetical protein
MFIWTCGTQFLKRIDGVSDWILDKSHQACNVFTRRLLVTASKNGCSFASVLKSSLKGGSLPNELSQVKVKVKVKVVLRLAVYRQ